MRCAYKFVRLLCKSLFLIPMEKLFLRTSPDIQFHSTAQLFTCGSRCRKMSTTLDWEIRAAHSIIAIFHSRCGIPMHSAGRNRPILYIRTFLSYLRCVTDRPTEFFSTIPIALILTLAKSHGTSTPSARMVVNRSEERRVGKECRSRWSP